MAIVTRFNLFSPTLHSIGVVQSEIESLNPKIESSSALPQIRLDLPVLLEAAFAVVSGMISSCARQTELSKTKDNKQRFT